MAIEVQLPDIGAESGEVTEILVAVGDSVEADTPLMVVEGEKAAIEIPSPEAGKITGIEVKVGDEISSGTLIVTMEGDASAVKEEATTASFSTTSRVETVKVTLPDVVADTVEVTEVMVAAGDTVEKDQPIVVVEGEKATVEVPSPHDGAIQ